MENPTAMFLCIVRIYPSPGSEHSILEVLESLKGPTLALQECVFCSVSVETGESGAFCYSERWRSRDALEQHLRSPLYGRVLEAMEFSLTPPEIEFYEVNEMGGLDIVEQARMTP